MSGALIHGFLNKHIWIRYLIKNIRGKGIVENYFRTNFKKNCLIMYVMEPFQKDDFSGSHQLFWQELQMAKILSSRGYNIDIIDYNNTSIFLRKKYDFIIDLIPGRNNVIKHHMNSGCIMIAYLTGSNPSFQNAAENKRLQELEERRGILLKARRQSPVLNERIENYTACFMIGNDYNWKTYNEFDLQKPYYIKNTGHIQAYSFDSKLKRKDCFLYFGSKGQVHKGLDLLLEIFSENNFPAELYVCGTFMDEPDFASCYHHELYDCDNIHPIGFVNITEMKFKELTDLCVYSIMPSCSEARAGSVLTTMSAGLINICSKECGFDDGEVVLLDNCKIDTIRQAIIKYSQMDDDWIMKMSKQSYDISQTEYGQAAYIESFEAAVDGVLEKQKA